MKIYTRTGDDGTTGLFGAGRVSKSHPRIDAYGTVDELNAVLGQAHGLLGDSDDELPMGDLVRSLQNDLFVLGGDLAAPGRQKHPVPRIGTAHVEHLERTIDRLEADLPALRTFILPGGSAAGATLHVARTVCRRAERRLVDLASREEVSHDAMRYLNRLSDLLFVMARWVNHRAGEPEVAWRAE